MTEYRSTIGLNGSNPVHWTITVFSTLTGNPVEVVSGEIEGNLSDRRSEQKIMDCLYPKIDAILAELA